MPNARDYIPALGTGFIPAALPATTSAAPAGGTGVAAGGWSTAAGRDAAIATINNLKSRVDALEAALKALGFLA